MACSGDCNGPGIDSSVNIFIKVEPEDFLHENLPSSSSNNGERPVEIKVEQNWHSPTGSMEFEETSDYNEGPRRKRGSSEQPENGHAVKKGLVVPKTWSEKEIKFHDSDEDVSDLDSDYELMGAESGSEDSDEENSLPSSEFGPTFYDNPPCPLPDPIPFKGYPGLLKLPETNSPINFFFLLFTSTIMNRILEQTNKYGNILKYTTSHLHGRMKNFRTITMKEFRIFLGIYFHMGHLKLPRITDYWRRTKLFYPAYGEFMSRNRFLQIFRALYFNFDLQSPGAKDRFDKIRPMIYFFNDTMEAIYKPNRELCIDDPLVLWHGRLISRQYVRDKCSKFGVRLYMLTEPNGLVLRCLVYLGGSNTDLGGPGHSAKVVQKLMEKNFNLWHSLYTGSYYSSLDLVNKLREKGTYCTGTLKPNKKDNPKDVVEKKLSNGEMVQRFTDKNICILKWKDRKDKLIISSELDGELVETGKSNAMKPRAAITYSKYMGGTDHKDQIMAFYSCERKTMRWFKKIGLHIIQLMMLNSYYLFVSHTKSKQSILNFRTSVIEELVGSPPPNVYPSPSVAIHLPEPCLRNEKGRIKKRRCVNCHSTKKMRVDTNYYCPQCPERPGLCLENCFRNHHNYL